MKVLAVFALFVAVAFGALGVDVSDLVSVSAFQCLKNQGYTYAIVRCFRSTGSADPNCAQSVANAHSAGMSNVDIYVFPCPTCSAGGGAQINATLTYVQQHGVKYNTMWLDIEGPQYWKSTSSNTYFFNEMVAAAKQHGVNLGVYTSSSQWTPIMGSFTGGANFPLWYAHYDNVQSFSDFSPFGGWNTPSMKQYNGDQTACGVGIDMNYSPGGPSTVSSATSGGQTTTHSTSGGPATTGGHSSSGPATTGGHSTSGGSGPSNSGGKTSSSGGQTSGETSSGQSTGATGTTGQTTTSYSSGGGSSGSSGGGQFQLDNDSIYSSKNGGKRIPIKVDDLVTKDLYAQQPAKITKKAASLRKGYDLAELEERLEETQHFSVWEEKSSKKFL